MADWHGYFGMENLGLDQARKQLLVDELKQLGAAQQSKQPAFRNHWRVRLDNEAVIFEAMWNEDNLTIQMFKNRLAALYGIDPAIINDSVVQQSFGGGTTLVITFSVGVMDYLRVAMFGGVGSTWEQSRTETIGYLLLYQNEWEEE